MPSLHANTVSNVAFSLACLMFLVLGAIRINEWVNGPTATAPKSDPSVPIEGESLSIADAQVMGSPTAKVVLVEFSDFQCPFCARHDSQTHDSIKKEFVDSGKIRQAFMHLPLPNHPQANAAAESAECAGRQGRFWEMRKQLFINQAKLSLDLIGGLADAIQIDRTAFQTCLSGQTSATVAMHIKAAERLGLKSTPSFLIGRETEAGNLELSKKIAGAHSFDVFREALLDALKSS